jgi:hypothetical protein
MYKKGEITVFLSLIFVLLLSFILTMLDGVMLQTAKSDYRLAADVAIFSAFGEYQKELLEEFGVFALEGTYERGTFDERNLLERMAYYGAMGIEQDIEGIQLLTDNNGQAFKEQVLYYMEEKYGISYVVDLVGLSRGWEEQEIEGERAFKDEQDVLSNLTEALEEEEASLPTEENPIAHIDLLKSSPILSLVMPRDNPLSNLSISLDNQASRRSLRSGRGEFPARENINGVEQRLLYQEYLLEHFDYATSGLAKDGEEEEQEDTSDDTSDETTNDTLEETTDDNQRNLAYEIEYILEGQSSDAKNLERVVLKILAIRMGANYGYLIRDRAKVSQANAMAKAIASAVKLPMLSEAIKYAILFSWAFGESVVDIRALLEGKKVPMLKTNDSWQLSLTNLLTLGTSEDEETGRDDEEGLDYEDYLRGFLFVANSNNVTMRTIDRVEQNMIIEQEKDFFRADNCISKVRVRNIAVIGGSITYEFPLYFSYL